MLLAMRLHRLVFLSERSRGGGTTLLGCKCSGVVGDGESGRIRGSPEAEGGGGRGLAVQRDGVEARKDLPISEEDDAAGVGNGIALIDVRTRVLVVDVGVAPPPLLMECDHGVRGPVSQHGQEATRLCQDATVVV